MEHSWQSANRALKDSGKELLTMTATANERVATTWLDPHTGEQSMLSIPVVSNHFPALTPDLPEVAWDEREIHDLYGYVPDAHPDLRPLVRTPRWPPGFIPLKHRPVPGRPIPWLPVEPDNPSRTVEGEGITIMKVGPTHAGIIESGHFVFSLIGENVLYLDAHLFQNHRGIESMLEGLPISEAPPLITRICAADTVSNQTNWALAVEALAEFESTPALDLRRVALLESERVLSHLNDLAQIPAGVGFQVAHQRALALKEYWQRGLQRIYGHRFLFDTVTPGWAAEGSPQALLDLVGGISPGWRHWRTLVEGHHGFQDRMAGVGVVRLADAERLSAQGVAARAAGKAFDARTVTPFYQNLDLHPALASSGDVKARFALRLAEVEESLALIDRASAQLLTTFDRPGSPILPMAGSGRIVTFTESPHGLNAHEVIIDDGHVLRYHIRTGAYRNWSIVAKVVAGNAVADFPLINKSFELCYSCCDR